MIRLGVNIDHVATIRNARGEIYPEPIRAALFAIKSGANSITINLIEDSNNIIVDNLKWNGLAKKSGFETGDLISEFKIENLDRPNKIIVYPLATILLFIFGYLNKRRKF